eukprot:15339467-Ditylum_brightwellii.AAC.3
MLCSAINWDRISSVDLVNSVRPSCALSDLDVLDVISRQLSLPSDTYVPMQSENVYLVPNAHKIYRGFASFL